MGLEIILHAGMGKTGSTSLQNTMASHRDVLARKGMLYPALASHTHHASLLPAILGDDPWPRGFGTDTPDRRKRVLEASDKSRDALCEAARTAPPETVLVISCEYIIGLSSQSMSRLQERLRLLANEITPVVYVRSPADHYLSNVQQGLKFDHRIPSHNPTHLRESLCRMIDVFGVRPRVRVFSESQLYNGCIVQDFLIHHAGFEPEALQGIDSLRSNTSLSAEGMHLIQRFNQVAFPKAVPFGNGLSKRVLELIRAEEALNPYTRPRLHPRIHRAISNMSRDELIWLEENFGCAMTGSGAPGPAGAGVLADVASVADLCPLDVARLEQMTQAVFPNGLEDHLAAMVARQHRHRQKNAAAP